MEQKESTIEDILSEIEEALETGPEDTSDGTTQERMENIIEIICGLRGGIGVLEQQLDDSKPAEDCGWLSECTDRSTSLAVQAVLEGLYNTRYSDLTNEQRIHLNHALKDRGLSIINKGSNVFSGDKTLA